ncbi:MAG: hypothetical protein HOJ21_11970 [Alphaproteobacteria bacterium]|jgi:2-keto-4-pentenoate hydratase|nr:hypothetical protein [Alphaproteobacteria bacterium]
MAIADTAQALFDARRANEDFKWLKDTDRPETLADAYSAQSALLKLWDEAGDGKIGGWKIAITSKAMQALCGIDQPCVGGMLDSAIHNSPMQASLGDYGRLGLEFELAVRMGSEAGMGRVPYDATSIRAHVGAVMPAFELIDDRNADYEGFDAHSLIADNTWNAGVILGDAIPNWQSIDWVTQPVTLDYNGKIETAVTGDAMGDPFAALAVVANNLLSRGLSLKPGDIVITGSTLQTRFAAAGDHATYQIDGFPSVELRVSE